MSDISVLDHIIDPDNDLAGESLGRMHESVWAENHRRQLYELQIVALRQERPEMDEEDLIDLAWSQTELVVDEPRVNARIQRDTLRSLGRVGGNALSEITRRGLLIGDWLPYSEAEYDSLREVFEDTLGDALSKGQISDMTFAVEEFLPFCANHELDLPQAILTRNNQGLSGKGRAAIPALRRIMNSDLPEEEQVERVQAMMEMVADPNETEHKIRAKTEGNETVPNMLMYEYVVTDNRSVYMIVASDRQRTILSHRLEGYVDEHHLHKTPEEFAAQEGVIIDTHVYQSAPIDAERDDETIPL